MKKGKVAKGKQRGLFQVLATYVFSLWKKKIIVLTIWVSSCKMLYFKRKLKQNRTKQNHQLLLIN